MSHSIPALALLAASVCVGCKGFDPPPVNPPLTLTYPEGFAADLPHLNPGDTVEIAVEITTSRGRAVEGVGIRWEDGFVQVGVQPHISVSDNRGIARAHWEMRPLSATEYSKAARVRGYLPGANNSPVEYRALVIRCSKGC